jgi:hypothetical protein
VPILWNSCLVQARGKDVDQLPSRIDMVILIFYINVYALTGVKKNIAVRINVLTSDIQMIHPD